MLYGLKISECMPLWRAKGRTLFHIDSYTTILRRTIVTAYLKGRTEKCEMCKTLKLKWSFNDFVTQRTVHVNACPWFKTIIYMHLWR